MQTPKKTSDTKDPLDQIKEEIRISQVDPDIIQLASRPCEIVRHGDKLLSFPTEENLPIVSIHSSPDSPSIDAHTVGRTIGELLDLYKRDNQSYIGKIDSDDEDRPDKKYPLEIDSEVVKIPWNSFIESIDNKEYCELKEAESSLNVEKLRKLPAKKDKLEITLSPNKRFLIVQITDTEKSKVFEITDEKGELLTTDKWKEHIFSDRASLLQAISENKFPGVTPKTFNAKKNAEIENPNIQISLTRTGVLEIYDETQFLITSIEEVADFVQDRQRPERIYAAMKGTNTVRIFDLKERKMIRDITLPEDVQLKGINIDNNNNLLICSYTLKSDSEKSNTAIVSKTTGEVIISLDAESDTTPSVTTDGTIICPQKESEKPLVFRTNLNRFEEGVFEKAEREAEREKVLKELEGKSPTEIAKALEELEATQEETKEDVDKVMEKKPKSDPRINALKKQIEDMFLPEIDTANGNITALKKVERKLRALKSGKIDPTYAKFPELFEDIEEKLQQEIENATLEELRNKLINLAEKAKESSEYEEMKKIEEEFSKAMRQRRRISKEFNGKELEARKVLEDLRDNLQKKEGEIKKTLIDRLEKQWVAVETAFEEIYTIEDLEKSHELSEIQRLEELYELIDDKDILREWRQRLSKLKATKRDEIRTKERAEIDHEKQRIRDLIDSISEDIGFVDDELDHLTDEQGIDNYYGKSPLVERIKNQSKELDSETRKELWGNLKRVFQNRKKELKTKERVEDKTKNEAFGFPIFTPEEPRIEPIIKRINRKSNRGALTFRDNMGNEWSPPLGTLPFDKNDEETREMIELYRDDAKYHLFGEEAERVRPLVPNMHKEWVISEETENNLKDIGRLLDKQMRRQNGVLILVGEAGSGKNVLADMFGHFTNREVFEFSCNKQSEKEDVQFSFEFDPKKGTYKVPSNVIKALQTPGAVLVFDEINTLPPGTAKILNPLFDHRRKLIMPDGTVIKAHPSVVIIGMMNPGNYIGTNPLPQEVRSRARMKEVEYPQHAINEAVLYMPLLSSLKDLSTEEFNALWKKTIDGQPSTEADKVESEDRTRDMRNLKEMIKLGQLLRAKYKETQMGEIAAGSEVNFIFSLRDGGQVIEEMEDNHKLTVKDSMKAVIVPKIDDPEEETTMNMLIDNA